MLLAFQAIITSQPRWSFEFDASSTCTAEPSGGAAGRHTHPGAETGYVLEGELELIIDGKPPLKVKAGEPLAKPAP